MLSAQNPMLSAQNPMLSANSNVGPPMLTNRYPFSVRYIGKAGVSMIEEEEEYFHFIIFCCHVGKAKVSSGTPFCLHCHVESYVTGQMPIL